jgi:hypothetical protein
MYIMKDLLNNLKLFGFNFLHGKKSINIKRKKVKSNSKFVYDSMRGFLNKLLCVTCRYTKHVLYSKYTLWTELTVFIKTLQT